MDYKLQSYCNHTKKYMPSYFQENIMNQKLPTVKLF